jgi:sulfate adenylyltransferase subunit 1 (EFTu-like GTPase family)
VSGQFAAHIIWMSDKALMPGRSYLTLIGTKATPFTVAGIKYKSDVDSQPVRYGSLEQMLREIVASEIRTTTRCTCSLIRRLNLSVSRREFDARSDNAF